MKLIRRHIQKFEQFIHNSKNLKDTEEDLEEVLPSDPNEDDDINPVPDEDESDIFEEIKEYFENQKRKRQ